MKNISLFLLLICLISSASPASARHKKTKKQKDSGKGPESVRIEYGPCFGRCAIYTIELDKTGKVTYTGIRFAPDSGAFSRSIAPAEAGRILKLVETYQMDTCKDRYRVMIPDIQVFSYHLYYKKSEKAIINATFGPVFLKELAAELVNVGEKKKYDDWVKAPISMKN